MDRVVEKIKHNVRRFETEHIRAEVREEEREKVRREQAELYNPCYLDRMEY